MFIKTGKTALFPDFLICICPSKYNQISIGLTLNPVKPDLTHPSERSTERQLHADKTISVLDCKFELLVCFYDAQFFVFKIR